MLLKKVLNFMSFYSPRDTKLFRFVLLTTFFWRLFYYWRTNFFCLNYSTTSQLKHVQKTTRMKIVDDSQLAKDGMTYKRAPKIIHIYTKTGVGTIGDKILLAVNGQKQKAIIVGCKNYERKEGMSCFDTNNCVLVDDTDTLVNCAKISAIATRFV